MGVTQTPPGWYEPLVTVIGEQRGPLDAVLDVDPGQLPLGQTRSGSGTRGHNRIQLGEIILG